MISHSTLALISIIIFSFVHIFAERIGQTGLSFHARVLSAGGGVSIAYVFIDLLPTLSKGDVLVKESMKDLIP